MYAISEASEHGKKCSDMCQLKTKFVLTLIKTNLTLIKTDLTLIKTDLTLVEIFTAMLDFGLDACKISV